MTVLCLVEHESGEVIDASAAALTFARTLAQSLAAAVAGPPADPKSGAAAGEGVVAVLFRAGGGLPVETLAALGVSDVIAVEPDRLASYAPLAWARVLGELTASSAARAVVAAGTDRGNEVLAHLGAITGVPMVAGCVTAAAVGATDAAGEPAAAGVAGQWRIVRQRWAGSLLEDAVLDAAPALLTVAYDAVAAVAAAAPGAARVRVHNPAVSDDDLRVRVVESAKPSAGVSLATARVVVGGGRGVGGADGFAVIEELAALLGGAVGVSRVVTSQGWRPHTQQVGQTGTRIAPELYLACGISGAIQHMAGCLGAKHIVVINTDADAPIIGRADYAVIGDLKEVVPALVTAIRARNGSDG